MLGSPVQVRSEAPFLSSPFWVEMSNRRNISSGSPFEGQVGFSRAVRVGNRTIVAGTAPIEPNGAPPAEGAAAQMRRCLEIIRLALEEAGVPLSDVVRTRTYLVSADDATAVGDVHREYFGDIRPASTMVVVAGLLHPDWRVEVEAEAQS